MTTVATATPGVGWPNISLLYFSQLDIGTIIFRLREKNLTKQN